MVGDDGRVIATLTHTAEERSTSSKADVSHIDLNMVIQYTPWICPLQSHLPSSIPRQLWTDAKSWSWSVATRVDGSTRPTRVSSVTDRARWDSR